MRLLVGNLAKPIFNFADKINSKFVRGNFLSVMLCILNKKADKFFLEFFHGIKPPSFWQAL